MNIVSEENASGDFLRLVGGFFFTLASWGYAEFMERFLGFQNRGFTVDR